MIRDDIPPITEAQAEALDYLHYTAEKYSLSVNFKKGDIQYISNTSIFHARNGYTDSEKNRYVLNGLVEGLQMGGIHSIFSLKFHLFTYRRHLLRLWLRPDNAWDTPEPLKDLWDKLYVNEREEHFPLEPTLRH
jgi:hypothetical protein